MTQQVEVGITPTWKEWYQLIIPLTRTDIHLYTHDEKWQRFRCMLSGEHLTTRFHMLRNWIEWHNESHASRVQVANYVNALKRGGMI